MRSSPTSSAIALVCALAFGVGHGDAFSFATTATTTNHGAIYAHARTATGGRASCLKMSADPLPPSSSSSSSRRRLLQSGVVGAGSGWLTSVLSQPALPSFAGNPAGVGIRGADPNGPPYQLPPLPFAVDALEPYIAAESIKAVYEDHAKSLDELNTALKGKTPVALAPLQSQTKAEWRDAAGGHYNHCLFFETLTAQDDSLAPGPVLRKQFDADFGGEDGLLDAFQKSAASLTGDGWIWLTFSKKGRKLSVSATTGETNPLMTDPSNIPFLALNMNSHAYAAKYDTDKAKYVDAFFNGGIINWKKVTSNYLQFVLDGAPVPCVEGDLLAAPPPSYVR